MRILFTSDQRSAPSTAINLPNFRRLSEIEGVAFTAFERDYENYDVILFMGYDPDVAGVRSANPGALAGIIDPRARDETQVAMADFVIVNGLEMQDWCAAHNPNIFTYPIYPFFHWEPIRHTAKETLTIGYHGNKIHLQTMFPHVIAALKKLSETHKIELRAIYNIAQLGAFDPSLFDDAGVTLTSVQWSETVYEKHLPDMDIGIAPNLIPVPPSKEGMAPLSPYSRWYDEHPSDCLLRCKKNSNAGRVFVFAQYGIPVVADFTPSMGQVIRDGRNGFLAESAEGWHRALKRLADSRQLRQRMGERLCADCRQDYSIEALNVSLIDFIRGLDRKPPEPLDIQPDWSGIKAGQSKKRSLSTRIKRRTQG
ncbi:MAG TPA: hypothetical protein ENI79_00750 [Rhodospirillales bacterium]|nr:hypothetical protein [Rhodospirillales bacterium]